MASLESIGLFSNCGAGDVDFALAGFRFRILAEIDEHRLMWRFATIWTPRMSSAT